MTRTTPGHTKLLSIALVCVVLLGYYIFVMAADSYVSEYAEIQIVVISSLLFFLLELCAIARITGTFLNPTNLFLLSYYVFQNGQFLLYSLGIEFDTFYFLSLRSVLFDAALFSSISNLIAGVAGIATAPTGDPNACKYGLINAVDSIPSTDTNKAIKVGFSLLACIEFPLMAIKLNIALSGGYESVRTFESAVPSVIGFADYMFMPFALLALVFSDNKKFKNRCKALTVIWLLIVAFCGDRTTGIAGLFVVFYIEYVQNGVSNIKRIAKLFIGAAFLLVIVRIIAVTREQGSIVEAISNVNFLVSFVGELGGSSFPLMMAMTIVPGSEQFLHGTGYLLSFIGGAIPSFLDPSGTIEHINELSRYYNTWQSTYFSQYTFGVGWSLNAEAYANFGWFGLVALFLVNFIIFKLLNTVDFKKPGSGFALYWSCILLFFWLTLPRRESYYIWKAFVYCILFVSAYLCLFRKDKKSGFIGGRR